MVEQGNRLCICRLRNPYLAYPLPLELRVKALKRRKKTLIFVSHSPDQVKALCDRVIWLEHGTIKMDGGTGNVLDVYMRTHM